MVASSQRVERFSGFSDAAIDFLLELQAEQSRAWFKAHQAEFVRLCRRPLELFVSELRERLRDTYPAVDEVEPHVFRIQRDTRFGPDRAPYKSNVAAQLALRVPRPGQDAHAVPVGYVSFGLDGELVGVGCWHMQPDVLARFRSAVADPSLGPALQASIDGPLRHGWTVASIDVLKRVPRPYPQDHPRAELLKRKGLALSVQPPGGVRARPEFVDWAVERLRQVEPFVAQLDRALDPENS